ncbi:MAG: ribonuclease P protein component [Bacteroidales bacterium]|nr:ribonuclease P protein component [Bacteroidales bacterium]
MDFSLPRKDIIRSKKEVETLLEKGEVLFRYPIKAYWLRDTGAGACRMMVSVPKRNFKRAVKRNRLKRLVREAFRLNRNMLGGAEYDFLFVYLGKEICDYGAVESRIREIFRLAESKAQKSGELASGITG